jgi:hypothetical protein
VGLSSAGAIAHTRNALAVRRVERTPMKSPTVRQAHDLCDLLKARAVIVLAFSEDNIAGASYGETKPECKFAGFTMDQIITAIQEGKI